MKVFFTLILSSFLLLNLAKAQTCQEVLKSYSFGQNYNPDFLGIDGSEFIYLTTLLQTRIQDPSIDSVDHVTFRLKKLDREDLLGVRIDNDEGRRIFTELLRFSYRSLSREELKVGRSLFSNYSLTNSSERLAKALIEFHLGERHYNLSNRAHAALRIIGATNDPRLMWHKAEMYSRIGKFVSAQNLLIKILQTTPEAPYKVNVALALTQLETHRPLPVTILDRLDAQRSFTRSLNFDYSDWGAYSNE